MDKENLELWENIEKDKKKYKVLLGLSVLVWGLAICTLAYIGYLFYIEHQHVQDLYSKGVASILDLNEAKKNIYTVVLSISFIIASLLSLVVIMRQRSASLQDIQLRLALVEQHISSKD